MESRAISWDKIAVKQFAGAIGFIAADSIQNAEKVHSEIIKKIEAIPANPEMFPADKYKLNNNGRYRAFELHRFRIALLSPAYDLVCTALHLDDANICMRDGLSEGDYKEPAFEKYGIYTRESFLSLADKVNIPARLAENILDEMTGKEDAVKEMVNRSFLSKDSKSAYYHIFEDRQKRLHKNYTTKTKR